MSTSETAVKAQSATTGDIQFAGQLDSGTGYFTPEMADLAARASLASMLTSLASILAKLSGDPATQTTLAAVLAKLTSDPATNTTLATAATTLSSILAKLPASPALDATLSAGITSIVSAINASTAITGTVTANLGTIGGAATQTTLAAVLTALTGSLAITAASLPLPAGAATQTTLAAILTALGAALPLPTGAATAAKQDTTNTTLAPASTGGTVGSFTSTVSAQMLAANTSRKGLIIRNEGAGTLYVLYGTGTASATNYSFVLLTGDVLTDTYQGAVQGLFASAGTARTQETT